jgi:hypothetical protein
MKDSTVENLLYCKELVKKIDYARYVQCAFAPRAQQAALYAYFALNCELRHVYHAVSEEMIGHIRFAWWQESVEGLFAGQQREHPVLQMLVQSGFTQDELVNLVVAYREAYPEMPSTIPEPACEGAAFAKYHKAGTLIANHRGNKLTLIIKLMLV